MAFVKLMYKAGSLDTKKRRLLHEKKYASSLAEDSSTTTKKIKPRHRIRRKLLKIFHSCKLANEKSPFYRFWFKLRHEGSLENYILKSIVGFIGGFILTYMFFMFFVFQLNFTFSTATIMCSIFGSILTIGLAFSYNVRCIVFLTLPQLFSKRGRQALLAYAFILAITGPAKNTLNNMGILSESLACGQEQLKQAVKTILEVVKKPFYAIRDAIKSVVKVVKVVVKKLKEVLLSIKRVIVSILKVIKTVFQFLARILNVCNKELGTPFQRCTRVFESAVVDCHAKLGPMFSWLCSIAYLAQAVCYTVKMFDFICILVDYIGNSVIGVVIKKVKSFIRHIKTMFYVRIRFSHSFHFETNASKSIEDVAAGIVTEVKERTEGLIRIFDFMSCATSLFFLFIVFRVLYYRYKFLSDERFDNRFITKEFRSIDIRRAQLGKETVLPLNKRERNVYISVGSLRLVKKEKRELSQTAVVLGIASLKLGTHMVADYALFWVLTLIRQHASFQSSYDGSNIPKLEIKGTGLLSDLLRSIVKAFQPAGIKLEIDTVPCLPDPIPPDFDRYVQIGSLLVICWILTIFEPYGLRWRNSVMCFYHPLRGKQRAIWLYNHILRTRTSFLKFIRRQLRRKFGGDKTIDKMTFKEFLTAHLMSIKIFHYCIKPENQKTCLVCGEVFREGDQIKPIRCATPGCAGLYCEKCFEDLQNICTICLDPIQYGDLSDISEEKDSSADDVSRQPPPKKKKKRKKSNKSAKSKVKWFRCSKKKETTTDSSDTDKSTKTTSASSPHTDSDYYSTDTSAHTYQYEKDITKPQPLESLSSMHVDVEKQHIPDYVSMETFREDTYRNDTNKNEGKLSSTQATFGSPYLGKLSRVSVGSKSSLIDAVKPSRKKYEDEIPLLELYHSEDTQADATTGTSSDTTFIDSSTDVARKRRRIRRRQSSTSSETTFIETPKRDKYTQKFSPEDSETDTGFTAESYTTSSNVRGFYGMSKKTVAVSAHFDPPYPPAGVPKLNLDFTLPCQCGCGTNPCTCHYLGSSSFHSETETARSARSASFCHSYPQISKRTHAKRMVKRESSTSSAYSQISDGSPRLTVNYLYDSTQYSDMFDQERHGQKPKQEVTHKQHLGEWETVSYTSTSDVTSYRTKVKNYYAKINAGALEAPVQRKEKKVSKLKSFIRRVFRRVS